jgi:misacylated tRNA(Ala) deacylase
MTKLYLDDPYRAEFDAEVAGIADGWVRLSCTAFYPGGGGQPADPGYIGTAAVTALREDEAHEVWHQLGGGTDLAPGAHVRGAIDWPYRHALMRHHGLMHVVNTVARDHFGGVITGVQIGPERSRIDFRLNDFSRGQSAAFEARVNDAITRDLAIRAGTLTEAEYRARPELVRTLNVAPPIIDGLVRVVEIEGFDAQACGATTIVLGRVEPSQTGR